MEANRRLEAEGAKPLLVPGVIRRGSAIKVAGAMISENEIRQADTPLGRAKKMADNLARGYDEEDLALLFGCNVATRTDQRDARESPCQAAGAGAARQGCRTDRCWRRGKASGARAAPSPPHGQ
ncbi:hypothetical protein G6F31_019831 [Rhizopus arrhizus]|nr:hypothetical protein G6F31_019831 [Rhizopus arrhizus]